jgi:exonuclease 3'-5' domain-containing protein 1
VARDVYKYVVVLLTRTSLEFPYATVSNAHGLLKLQLTIYIVIMATSATSNSLAKVNIHSHPVADLLDTAGGISALVDIIYGQPAKPPSLYIDLEGVNLSRHGSISILQIYLQPENRTYLVDIHTLGHTAFSTRGSNGSTLKELLESESIPKVFFDVRNDSDALYSHFQIKLAGIQDLQLMELATRTFSKAHVNGLGRCIERDAPLSSSERVTWKLAKEKGLKLFAPERGGSYEVFNQRPVSDEIRLYCVQDVRFLPQLWNLYHSKMTQLWKDRVQEASRDRVRMSQSRDYIGKGQHMALAPAGWS